MELNLKCPWQCENEIKSEHYSGKILLPILEFGKLRLVFMVFFQLSVYNLGVHANLSQQPELSGPAFPPPEGLEGAPPGPPPLPPSCLHPQPMGSDYGCSDPKLVGWGPTLSESRHRKGSSDTAEGCDLSPLRLRITVP